MTDYRYQVGGSLNNQDDSYVTREADTQLYQALQQGEFCYVLNSRQMGKSSLLVRTKHRLEQAGFCCAAIDLTGIGSEYVTPEQWYRGFISQLYLGFNLLGKVNLKQWWLEQEDLTLIQKLNNFLTDVLLVHLKDRKIVIFIDEVDSVFSLPFSTDDFFAFIRFCYNQRAIAKTYESINFAIFGVATPSSLIRDKQRTPFNIGKAIELTGFTLEESIPLVAGFNLPPDLSKTILQKILLWTAGQPFLTQKLCQLAVENGVHKDSINHLVEAKIIHNWEVQDEPEHLRTISNRILRNENTAGRLLGIYQQILSGVEVTRNDSREHLELLLSGLVVNQQGKLQVKNQIYQRVFNHNWVAQQLANIRPYAKQFNQWIASEQNDQASLLTGLKLQQALAWSIDKQLSDLDYRFLAASQKLAKQQVEQDLTQEKLAREKVSIALEAATEANRILVKAKKTAQQKTQSFRLGKTWLLGFTLSIASIVILLRSMGLFQSMELAMFDKFLQLRPLPAVNPYIAIITINESDLQQLQQYPLSDRILARAISNLKSYQPRMIGLDIYRDLPVEPGYQELNQLFKTTPNLIGIEKIVGSNVNPPKTLAALGQVGFNDQILDRDGKIRRALLSYRLDEDNLKFSLALKLVLGYLEPEGIKPETSPDNPQQIQLGKAIFTPFKSNDGGYILAKAGGYQILLNYYGHQNQFETFSLTDLLTNNIPPEAIKDRIVLIGTTAESLNDLFQTPYSSQYFTKLPKLMPGVVIHANVITQLLDVTFNGKGLLKVLSELQEWLWILVWSAIGSSLAWKIQSYRQLLLTIIITAFLLIVLSYLIFLQGWWLPLIPTLIVIAIAVITLPIIITKQLEKIQLRQTVKLVMTMNHSNPAAVKIALEYLKQRESPEKLAIIENTLNSINN